MFEGLNLQILVLTLENFLQILKNWWWIILPFIFLRPFLFLWLWWRREAWKKQIEEIMLEIKLPEEILKPIRAMEAVFNSLWQIYDPPSWKEKWFEGKKLLDLSLEIASIDGVPHFYIRIPASLRDFIESSIYAQYPEVEISKVEDYTNKVPKNIPNETWDLWGCDMMPFRDDIYPFRTYKEFETERETKEEKRIDPIATLLESMGRLKEGEQLWIQFIVKPVTPEEIDLPKKAEKVVQKMMGKTAPPSLEAFIPYAIKGTSRVLIAGEALPEGKEPAEEKLELGALRLSPGEVEVIRSIQNKVAKYGFESNIRFIYLGRKGAFFKPNLKLALGFFNEFNTQDLNTMKPWGKTKTKIQYFLIQRRNYLRKRRIFRLYCNRRSPLDPREGGTFVLSTEELASMYHFPSRIVAPAPTVPRIPAKRGEAPPELPTE
jgi:uncharacterized protein YggT (Ycf19 family)